MIAAHGEATLVTSDVAIRNLKIDGLRVVSWKVISRSFRSERARIAPAKKGGPLGGALILGRF
jgi:hypothetical protein